MLRRGNDNDIFRKVETVGTYHNAIFYRISNKCISDSSVKPDLPCTERIRRWKPVSWAAPKRAKACFDNRADALNEIGIERSAANGMVSAISERLDLFTEVFDALIRGKHRRVRRRFVGSR